MPSRGVAEDPFVLMEGSHKINTSISVPIAYLKAMQKYKQETRISMSEFINDAIEAHAKTVGMKLPKVKR